jgi:hypothetical protein
MKPVTPAVDQSRDLRPRIVEIILRPKRTSMNSKELRRFWTGISMAVQQWGLPPIPEHLIEEAPSKVVLRDRDRNGISFVTLCGIMTGLERRQVEIEIEGSDGQTYKIPRDFGVFVAK